MNHLTLIAQHDAIDAATKILLRLAGKAEAQAAEAARLLGLLAALVRDHLAVEDPVIYETVTATRGTRHATVAALAAGEFEQLKHDWTQYLYDWDEAAIAADWDGFARSSRTMLERLHERVTRESAILYALAQHYAVIDAK